MMQKGSYSLNEVYESLKVLWVIYLQNERTYFLKTILNFAENIKEIKIGKH